jgi:hypothetical protein
MERSNPIDKLSVGIRIGIVIISKHIEFNGFEEIIHVERTAQAGNCLEEVGMAQTDIHGSITAHGNSSNGPEFRTSTTNPDGF